VTRHLSVLGKTARTEVEVTRRRARDDGTETRGRRRRPSDVEAMLGGPIARREVYLRAGEVRGRDGRPAVYAASWWNEDALATYLPDEDASMWANLRTRHVELHREIREVYYGESEGLEAAFGERGPFWGRHYIFWSGGAPITVVYEVFNPAAFEKVLGPMRA
jgi:chorismate lyase